MDPATDGLTDRSVAAADRRYAELQGDTARIPEGPYCYRHVGVTTREDGVPILKVEICPYWGHNADQPQDLAGYCARLRVGDWNAEGLSLLFDQVKECGIADTCDQEDGQAPT